MEYEALLTVAKKLYDKFLIPFAIINSKDEIIFPEGINRPECYLRSEYLTKVDKTKIIFYEHKNHFFSIFICDLQGAKDCRVLVGPCGILGSSKNTYRFQNHDYIAGIHYSKESKKSFIEFIELLYALLTGKTSLNTNYKWFTKQNNDTIDIDTSLEQNLISRRNDGSSLDSYEFERRYIEAIRRNEPEKLEWIFKKMSSTYDAKLSINKLESLKYKCAALITILTRVSINSGVPILQAYSLSDSLIQNLGSINSSDECLVHIKECSFHFVRLIHQFPYSEKSYLVKQVLDYISEHIYEQITLSDLSEFTQKNLTYLSFEFRKEVGLTIHKYIIQKKIDEARHLLLFTSHSCKEIAALLNFSSQSHFIHTFKLSENLTPVEFRNSNFSSMI